MTVRKLPSVHPILSAGFTLVEILIAMAIFSVLLGGVYGAYNSQIRHFAREYRTAEADIEVTIARNLIERDIQTAGFGLPENFEGVEVRTRINPSDANRTTLSAAQMVPYRATNSQTAPDTLTLLGTALGFRTLQSQRWSFLRPDGVFEPQADPRDSLDAGDLVIVMEPAGKALLLGSPNLEDWLFAYTGSDSSLKSIASDDDFITVPIGSLIYGLRGDAEEDDDDEDDDITQPFFAVRYYLGPEASPASGCAPGTNTLFRAESTSALAPADGDPMFSCVLDFQVAFGLDTTENGSIDQWDNGGQNASGYTPEQLRNRLREIRVYILSHSGGRDTSYTYPDAAVRVGEGTAIGRDVTLTADQRNYRWKVTSLSGTPRNLR